MEAIRTTLPATRPRCSPRPWTTPRRTGRHWWRPSSGWCWRCSAHRRGWWPSRTVGRGLRRPPGA
jgi:hypothetical protein